MASPLSPLTDSAINTRLPSSCDQSFTGTPEVAKFNNLHSVLNCDDAITWEEETSSPFVTEVVSEPERRLFSSEAFKAKLFAAVEEGDENTKEALESGFNIAEDGTKTLHVLQDATENFTASSFVTAKGSPTKRSPTKSLNATQFHRESSYTFVRQENRERTLAMQDCEIGDTTSMTFNDDAGLDDTCFSTFSEVPNVDMTAFARLGPHSPTKQNLFDQITPRPLSRHTPSTARMRQMQASPSSASPTPRRNAAQQVNQENDTTNLLIDFTQQFEALSSQTQSLTYQHQARSPTRRSPSKGGQLLSAYLQNQRSPTKAGHNPTTPLGSKKTLLNLLDIELPPAPTPRSVPSITIRELESLKSDFASQISSLKATLSGREAEVEALKRAVSDAERRVGEAVESAREEKSKRECVEKEKEQWERRGRDFEDILKKVREEVIAAEKERTDVETRLHEAEERTREAEARAEEAEQRAVAASTKIVTVDAENAGSGDGHPGPLFTAEQVQKQIDEKVHALSTELHAIYKKKHITKVAGLKKGFEAKTKEKTAELQSKIDDLERRNEELQSKIDGTISGVLKLPTSALSGSGSSNAVVDAKEREGELERLKEQSAVIERQKAALAGKDSELRTVRAEFAKAMKELEQERVEKGELVAAVDEMLALQADMSTMTPAEASCAVEDFRKSIGMAGPGARPSGLARPPFAGIPQPAPPLPPSRIGPPPLGLNRSQGAGKSRMMSNIERMGGGRG